MFLSPTWRKRLVDILTDPIDLQVNEYLEYRKFRNADWKQDWYYLQTFTKTCGVKHVRELTDVDIHAYYEYLLKKFTTDYSVKKALDTLRAFLRYHKSRKNHNIQLIIQPTREALLAAAMSSTIGQRAKNGRPRNVKMVLEVGRMKEKEGLSFRQIARHPKVRFQDGRSRNISQIFKWYGDYLRGYHNE